MLTVDAAVPPGVRPACQAPERGVWPVSLEPAFPNLTFTVPVDVVWARSDPDRAYVVEYTGTVRVVEDPADDQAPVFLDVTRHLERFTGEIGLWDIAFHPDYPATPYVYAFLSGNGGGTDFRSMLLRYATQDDGLTVDPGSDTLLLAIERAPGASHGGGKIGFGPDGMLWISTGDGDGYGDPLGRAQDPTTLLGKMLRIDVNSASPYATPPDNPFAGGGGAPEVWALGFRNPWRWSFDRETGEVWVGDVGHDRVEEINRVTRGGNYGWNMREGTPCFDGTSCAGDFIDPVVEYGRDQGSCVTGGYVYRGTAIPELVGKYVFGDLGSGKIWALDGTKLDVLLSSGIAMTAFAEDPDGELLVTDLTGNIYRLSPADAIAPGVPAPYLSATGCLDVPAFVPFEVNAPLWSDGLDKQRQLFLPEGTRVEVQPDGEWAFPEGAMLFKTFTHNNRPIETRLLIWSADVWSGWSYRWFPSGLDAERLGTGLVAALDDRDWQFPSSVECTRCHTSAAGNVLGMRQSQVDRGGQLQALVTGGVVAGVTANTPPLVGLDDPTASLSDRARSYLDSNCAMCHRLGGPTDGGLDLRYGVSLEDTGACDRPPSFGALGIANNPRIIAPGASSRSVLLARMARRGADQMPPLGTFLVDDAAVTVIGAWIDSLSSCAQ